MIPHFLKHNKRESSNMLVGWKVFCPAPLTQLPNGSCVSSLAPWGFQGDSKVMAWVKIVHRKALEVSWLEDEEGRNVSKNAERYLDILKQVWEEMFFCSSRLQFWWMQDGAWLHTTEHVLTFLHFEFKGRVISLCWEIEWPPYLPDLYVLNYFWSYAMILIWRRKPATIEELKTIVEEVAHTFPVNTIGAAVTNQHSEKNSSIHPRRRGPLWSLPQTAIVVLYYPCIFRCS